MKTQYGARHSSQVSQEGSRSTQTGRGTPKRTASRKRSPLKILIFTVFVAALVAAGGTAAWAYTYNNTKDLSWYLNNPTAQEFTIASNGQLHAFSALVNGEAKDNAGNPLPAVDFSGKTVKLASGLNLFGELLGYEFTPIGTVEHPFAGTFNGQGNALSQLKITNPATTQNIGLFGVTGPNSLITGVNLNDDCVITLTSNAAPFINVGGVVGNAGGRVENCSSAAELTISHTSANYAGDLYSTDANDAESQAVFTNVGGVVGLAQAPITNLSHSGAVSLNTPRNAFTSIDGVSHSSVAKNLGGVAGQARANLTNSNNSGTLYIITSGSAGVDRFGSVIDSKSANVGGVAGYAGANVSNCNNSGNLLTSANPQASLIELGKQGEQQATIKSDGGGDGMGGVVGALRGNALSGMNTSGSDAGMAPGAPHLTLTDCTNTGYVSGLHAVGGVVGIAGTNTTITRCTNGIAASKDNTGHVRSTRWNKAATGGIAGQSFGIVSYSRNHAQVENTKTGYYTAGIVGMLNHYDAQPQNSEIYSCYNTGNIYCAGINASYREGGIVGENNGYVHDNVFMYGTVSTGLTSMTDANSVAAGLDRAVVNNTKVVYESQKQADASKDPVKGPYIGSGETVAILNTLAPTEDWQSYYFINSATNNGYPILNGQAASAGTVDLSQVATTIVLDKQAQFSAARNPVPRLKVSIVVDGKTIVLTEGADFKVLADPEALGPDGICKGITSGAAPYQASIEGIGNYSGSPQATVAYGIEKGNFAECLVRVVSATWTGAAQNNPAVTVLDAAGGVVAAEDYTVVVNSGKDCIEPTARTASGYPVVVTAEGSSNYMGSATGYYRIEHANLYSDTDVLGVYLDTSVWFFDEEVSQIYEVSPLLNAQGEFTYSTEDEQPYGIAGIMKVAGFEYYQASDGRTLTRATPKRTDPATGKPVYNDWEMGYTGTSLQPAAIGVLGNLACESDGTLATGTLLYGTFYDDFTNRDNADYLWAWGYTPSREVRYGPANTDATTSEVLPEASIVIQGNNNYSNYVYIDFKIRPVAGAAANLSVVQKTKTLNYAGGNLPLMKNNAPQQDERKGIHSALEVRYTPDLSTPEDYRLFSTQNWNIVFDHATTANDELITDDVYPGGAKLYYRLEPSERSSLLGWDSLLIEQPWVIASTANDRVSLADVAVATVNPDLVFDPSVSLLTMLQNNITVVDQTSGDILRQGSSANAGAQFDYYVYSPDSNNPGNGVKAPTYNSVTGKIEGTCAVRGTTDSKYATSILGNISYSISLGEFPSAASAFYTTAKIQWSFTTPGITTNVSRELYARAGGYSLEEIGKLIRCDFNWSVARCEWAFDLVDLTLDGVSVDSMIEPDKTYVAKLQFNPYDSKFFASSADEYYYVNIPYVRSTQANNLTSARYRGAPAFISAEVEFHEYIYTGEVIMPQLVVKDQNGNPYSDEGFVPLAVPKPVSATGQTKEPGLYNKENTGVSTPYTDVIYTGGNKIFGYNNAAVTNSKINATNKFYYPSPVYNSTQASFTPLVDLSFEIVAADIANPELVEIRIDDAYFMPGSPAEPEVSFYEVRTGEKLNYTKGDAGDYSLSYRDNDDIGPATLIITINKPEHLTVGESGTTLDLPFTVQGSAATAEDVVWDYADTMVLVNETEGALSSPGVLGSIENGAVSGLSELSLMGNTSATLPLDAYTVQTGTYDNGEFTEKTSSWEIGDKVYLQISGTATGLVEGSTVVGQITVVASTNDNTFSSTTTLTPTIASPTFTGVAAQPSVAVSNKDKEELREGRDYRWTTASKDAGENAAILTLTGLGAYAGNFGYSFTIQPASMDDLTVSVKDQSYSGAQIKPEASDITSVSLAGVSLAAADWTLSTDGDAFGPNLTVAEGGTLTLVPGSSKNLTGSTEVPFAITPIPLPSGVDITIDSQVYTGAAIELDADAIKMGTLEFGSDFAITGAKESTNVGEATVYLTGQGNYNGTRSATYEITPLTLTDAMVSGIEESYRYSSQRVLPKPSINLPASDYEVSYGANRQLSKPTEDGDWTGLGTVIVTPKGNNLTGDPITVPFKIIADLAYAQVEAFDDGVYNPDTPYKPTVEVLVDGLKLVEGLDYTLDAVGDSAGDKTLTVTALSPNVGEYTQSYKIMGRQLSAQELSISVASQVFSGTALTPEVEVYDGSHLLQKGVDYNLAYSNNLNATSVGNKAVVNVLGMGNYAGSVPAQFEIAPRSLADTASAVSISLAAAGKYTGQGPVGATVQLVDNTRLDAQGKAYTLLEGADYLLSYANNNQAGTATVNIRGVGNYDFTLTRIYTIEAALQTGNTDNTNNPSNTNNGLGSSGGENGGGNNYYYTSPTYVLPSSGAAAQEQAAAPTTTSPAASTSSTTTPGAARDNNATSSNAGNNTLSENEVPLSTVQQPAATETGVPLVYVLIIAGVVLALLAGVAASVVIRSRKLAREQGLRQ